MINIERRNNAITFNNHALQVVGHDKALAYRLLCSAVTVDPTMAVGWYALGNATADLKLLPASISCFRRALALPDGPMHGDMTPDLRAKCLVNLGHRLMQDGRIAEADEVSTEALDLLEAHPELDGEGQAFARTNLSLVRSIQCRTDESRDLSLKAYEISQEPIIQTGVGFGYLYDGDYAEGLKHFEGRFGYRLPQYLSYPYPRWDGGEIGTLFIAADQGLGDTISFARFVPAAAARGVGRVLFQVQGEILNLMAEAMRPWPNIEVIPQSTQFPIADAWCPVFSLPVALGFLSGEIRDCKQFWTVPETTNPSPEGWLTPGMKLHVGIAWGGSPDNDTDRWRSVELARFLELYTVPGVQLYSLQVGPRQQELHAIGAAGLIRDMSAYIRDASDTAAIVRDLDLVITVESFLGHLAGAMNHECWVMVSRRGGDWRIGRTGDKPLWYENHRLFRQHADMEWGPVFRDVVAALRERVGAR